MGNVVVYRDGNPVTYTHEDFASMGHPDGLGRLRIDLLQQGDKNFGISHDPDPERLDAEQRGHSAYIHDHLGPESPPLFVRALKPNEPRVSFLYLSNSIKWGVVHEAPGRRER